MNAYETYYPRPLMKRDSFFSLCGTWKLNGSYVEVPFPVESDLSGYKGNTDKLEYIKEFILPDNFYHGSDKVILHFGAIDQKCEVYLNNNLITKHEGGYLPFSININDYLEPVNTLKVIVEDNLDYFYPYGKQAKKPSGMWYTPVSGIWAPVWIESYDLIGIDNIDIHTDMDTLNIHIDSNSRKFRIEFEGYKKDFFTNDISIKIDNPHLWSIDDPYLYTLKISTNHDVIESYFALRKVEVKQVGQYKRIFLNNEPIFLNGLLDQGYYEDGLFIPKDPACYETEIKNIKELGFNTLRKHIKVELEAYYYYCDKYGILLIQDMVNSGKYHFFKDSLLPTIGFSKMKCKIKDQERYDFFIEHSIQTIKHLKSHPCIIGYTIYNEGWGQQGASLAYDTLKQIDPDRLFDSTSGWFFDDHSDFDSYHIYFRNKTLQANGKILLLSECGGFKRTIEGHTSKKGSSWGYGKASSEKTLTDKILKMYRNMYLTSIENGLCGAIMTQVSDIEGEINGLFTYDRQVCKVDKQKLIEANQLIEETYKKYLKTA